MTTESFKAAMRLSNGEEEIRSLNLACPFEYDNMVSLLKKVFDFSDVKIKAADEDNELVTLTSTADLSDAYKVAKDRNNKLKVWVYPTGGNPPRSEEEKVSRPSALTRSDSTNSESGLSGMTTPKYVPRKDREVAFVDPGSAKKKLPYTPTAAAGVPPAATGLVSSPSTENVTLCLEWLNDGCPLPEGECPKTHALSANWRCKNCNQTGHRLLDCPTKLCSYFAKMRSCRRGDACPLSHEVTGPAVIGVLPSPRTQMRADQAKDWRDKEAIKALGSSQSMGSLSGIPRHPGSVTPRLASSQSKETLSIGAGNNATATAGNEAFMKLLQQTSTPEVFAAFVAKIAQAMSPSGSQPLMSSLSASSLSAAQQAPAQVAGAGAPGGPTVNGDGEGSPKPGAKPRRTMASYVGAASTGSDLTSPLGGLAGGMTVKVGSEARDISALRKTRACRHWTEKGHCKLGDSCNFRHDPQLQGTGTPLSPDSARPAGTPRVACKFFQNNACRSGSECRFLHQTAGSTGSTAGSTTPSKGNGSTSTAQRRSQLSPNATAFNYPYDSVPNPAGAENGVSRCEVEASA